MKKNVLMILAAMAALSTGLVSAKGEQIVSIDSLQVMQESKEGKVLAEKLKAKINAYQEFVKKSQQDIAALQEDVTKKTEVLSKNALQEKTDQLNEKKKKFERELADKEESLRAELQREQIKLRDKQLAVANNMCESENWSMVIDKNTPGVLFVNKAIDKTSELLKRVDAMFDASATAQKETIVASNKSADAKKTAVKKA